MSQIRLCVLRRERKRTEKHLERQRKQEAEEAAAAEAAAKKAEEDERAAEVAAEARKQRQAEKKLTQKERARLRSLTAGRGGSFSLALRCSSKPCLSTLLCRPPACRVRGLHEGVRPV